MLGTAGKLDHHVIHRHKTDRFNSSLDFRGIVGGLGKIFKVGIIIDDVINTRNGVFQCKHGLFLRQVVVLFKSASKLCMRYFSTVCKSLASCSSTPHILKLRIPDKLQTRMFSIQIAVVYCIQYESCLQGRCATDETAIYWVKGSIVGWEWVERLNAWCRD